MTIYKFLFYWGCFWLGWCLGSFGIQISRGIWELAGVMVICIITNALVAYLGFINMNKETQL